MPVTNKSITFFYFLASVFAALASYRIHLEGLEASVFPIFDAITNFTGRAPDQYRILPYMIIQGIRKILEIVTAQAISPKYPILIFDACFLFFSAVLLDRMFSRLPIRAITGVLILLYPFLMFDGYRPTGSFILCLSSLAALLMYREDLPVRKSGFMVLLIVISFTRADVALLAALVGISMINLRPWAKIMAVMIPLLIQIFLSAVIFADAVYFSKVIMLADNFTGRYLFYSPLTYLVAASLCCYWTEIRHFLIQAWHQRRGAIIPILGYGAALFVIARPNEYRLFLPLLPFVLLLMNMQRIAADGE